MGAARTTLLLVTLTALLLVVGYLVGYIWKIPVFYTLTVAFSLAMAMNLYIYWHADKWVLKLYKAKVVSEGEEPELHGMVSGLAANAGLPKPRIAVVPNDAPNAFATGRNTRNAVVAVTRGAMDRLNREQLEGVLGHELAHIKNRDMLVNTMAAMVAGAIAYVALLGRFSLFMGGGGRRDGGGALLAILAMILVPIAAVLIRLSISRTREYGADSEGAKISGKPKALADALRSLQTYARERPMREGNPATSHMFIVNPFRRDSMTEIFSTHPSTEKRIQRLEALTAGV